MDPISILTSVSAASRLTLALSTTLFTFVQATRNVDQSVRALYDEVKGLILTLDAIGTGIKASNIGKGKQPEQNPELWKRVAASLDHCRGTVESMGKSLDSIKKSSSNFAGQALRAFKLNWKEDQINTSRSQIHSHNSALQLALQMINVHLSSRAPQLVTDDLVPRIEILTDMIMQLQLVQLQPSRNRHAQGILLTTREETDISSLMVSAHDVLSEAQSVIAQSETGSDRGSSASTMLHLNNFEGLFRDSLKITQGHQPIEPGGLPFDRHAAVEKWIPAAFPTDETTQSDNSSTNTQTQMTPTQSTFGTSAIGTEYAASATGEDSDEEDELEFDMLKGCLDQGVSFYKQGDWASGEKYFRRALADSKKLSSNKIQQRGIDLKDAQFKTAVCAFQQKRFDEAEAEMFHFNSRKSVNTEESNVVLRRVLATYLFAEICFQRNRIDEALKHCRKAHSMNKRLIGNTTDMPEVQANIFNLLMDIALCQWDFVAAEVYEAKELEYRVEPRPKLQMIDLEEILLSRLRRLQNVRELTSIINWNDLLATAPFLVAYFGSKEEIGAVFEVNFIRLSRKFKPGSFVIYTDPSFNGSASISLCISGEIAASYSVPTGDSFAASAGFQAVKTNLKDKKYDNFRL